MNELLLPLWMLYANAEVMSKIKKNVDSVVEQPLDYAAEYSERRGR